MVVEDKAPPPTAWPARLEMSTEVSIDSLTEYDCSEECEEDLKGRITRCRYVERSDVPRIAKLMNCRTFDTFSNSVHPGIVYERSCLSLMQENEFDEIVSAMFLCNYPNVLAVSPCDWPDWIKYHYNVKNSTELNTLFVHFLVWDDRYRRDFFGELLRATFYTVTFCLYVVLVQPPGLPAAEAVHKEMTRVPPRREAAEVGAQELYVGSERRFVPQMKFRQVVEEDNDDVIEILDADCKSLKEFYGEFYISEMVRHPVVSRRVIVAEKENSIAAVLCLNRNVDLGSLSGRFELGPFAELRKKASEPCWSSDEGEEEEHYSVESQESSIRSKSKNVILNNEASDENEYMEGSLMSKETEVAVEPESDAFALELLAFRNRTDELNCQQLISSGFEIFPDLDYCIALVPTYVPQFPFLDHFTRVPLKPDQDYPMALYVTHRALFQSVLRVRGALPQDYQYVECLMRGVSNAHGLLVDFSETLRRSPGNSSRSYVFTCDEVIIGLAIVCPEEEIAPLQLAYRLEDLAPRLENAGAEERFEAGRLLRLTLMPIFAPRLGLFLLEVARQANLHVLYYRARLEPCLEEDGSECLDVSPCIGGMQAVVPRIPNWPQFQRYFQRQFDDPPFDELFSLFIFTPRLGLIARETVNYKIVVVGASDCGLAFLDTLAFGYKFRDLQFADITLVSINGLPYNRTEDYTTRIMTTFRGRYCSAYRRLTPGRANYNVITGTLVEIDREKKCLEIEDAGSLSYDYLILTCGLLFHRPELKNDPESEEFDLGTDPLNCFLINDDMTANRCLEKLKRLTRNFKKKKSIVFHGCSIECYCALGAFLDAGLDGSWITLIEPRRDAQDDGFEGDSEVKKAIERALDVAGARFISNGNLIDWTYGDDPEIVTSLLVETEGAAREIVECNALISFQCKRPCLKTFLAISRAGLIFDGRLVINGDFRTNDPYIFAAGTLTKYSKKLRTFGRQLVHRNSLEVGEKLAERFVDIIVRKNAEEGNIKAEPTFTNFEPTLPDYSYRMPSVVACLLPGGYRYLRVQKPGVIFVAESEDAAEVEAKARAKDDVFTSGSCTADTGYFRLRLNQFRTVERITCCSKTDFDIQNIIALCGKHEAMLNDLRARFLNSEISDFFAYFREPWTTALFSDDFDAFLKSCKATASATFCKQSITEEMMSKFTGDNYKEISAEQRDVALSGCLANSCYPRVIEERLSEYLGRRENELPMYLTERKERRICREIGDAPLVYEDRGKRPDGECSCSSSTSTS